MAWPLLCDEAWTNVVQIRIAKLFCLEAGECENRVSRSNEIFHWRRDVSTWDTLAWTCYFGSHAGRRESIHWRRNFTIRCSEPCSAQLPRTSFGTCTSEGFISLLLTLWPCKLSVSRNTFYTSNTLPVSFHVWPTLLYVMISYSWPHSNIQFCRMFFGHVL